MSDGTLGDVIAPYVAEQCRVIREAEPRLRAGEPVIHSTRVAVRRLRSTLRTFGEAFDVAAAGWLEEELVWLATALGQVRDLEVLATRLTRHLAALPSDVVLGPVASDLETEIALRRKERWAEVLAGLDSERWTDLVRRLAAWAESPPFTDVAEQPAAQAKRYVAQADKRLRKRLRAALAAYDEGAPEAEDLLHSARKAGKRHRYAVELAEPLWGAKAAKIVARRKDLQDVLGDLQDSHVAAVFLRELGARYGNRSGRNGFTFGVLCGMELESRKGLPDRLRPLMD